MVVGGVVKGIVKEGREPISDGAQARVVPMGV